MNKIKVYRYVIFSLVLLNLVTLGIFLYLGRPGLGRNPNPDKIIISRLNLDDSQREAYRKLKLEHMAQMIKLVERNKQLHYQYFSLLKSDHPEIGDAGSVQKEIALVNFKIDSVTFDHLIRIKALGSADQKEKFNNLIDALSKTFAQIQERNR